MKDPKPAAAKRNYDHMGTDNPSENIAMQPAIPQRASSTDFGISIVSVSGKHYHFSPSP